VTVRRRALIVCPGRGSYGRASLGYLKGRGEAAQPILTACDVFRAERGRPTVTEMDSATKFQSKTHVAGENASLLTFACSLVDLSELNRDRYEIVGVTGNSMGWYTSLAAAGSLPLSDAVQLVETMGSYQAGNQIGGQLIYPLLEEDWSPSTDLSDAIEAALEETNEAGHHAYRSIQLGGYAVLGADRSGLKHLLGCLPKQKRGTREFPSQLPLHSAFHTPLLADVSHQARQELSNLSFQPPSVPLVDGHGVTYRPYSASPHALSQYTLGAQVTETFDFTLGLRTALRHTAPDLLILLGPGNSLGGPCAQTLLQENWRNLQDRAGLDAAQTSKQPAILSFGVAKQREQLV
jgi:[acyl-carrier-protein] S-malonyltransferase